MRVLVRRGLIVFCLISVANYLCHWVPRWEAPWVELPRDQRDQIKPSVFKLLSFGFSIAASDFVWISVLTDPSMVHTRNQYRPRIYYDLDLITEIDPLYFEAYAIGANLLATVRDDGLGAALLLRKAVRVMDGPLKAIPSEVEKKYWKDKTLFPTLLGYVELFELQNWPRAQEAFAQIEDVNSIPWEYRGLVSKVKNPKEKWALVKSVLDILLGGAPDAEAKETVAIQLQRLSKVEELRAIQREYDQWPKKGSGNRAWQRFLNELRLKNKYTLLGQVALSDSGAVYSTVRIGPILGMEDDDLRPRDRN